jgi:hypothetical protein
VEEVSWDFCVQVAHLKKDRYSYDEDWARTKSGRGTGSPGSDWTCVDGGSSIASCYQASVRSVAPKSAIGGSCDS